MHNKVKWLLNLLYNVDKRETKGKLHFQTKVEQISDEHLKACVLGGKTAGFG